MSLTSGQPSPVSLGAAKAGSYPATITAAHPTATPSSLSIERKEPYQHSPRPLTSEERARQNQQSVTQQMLRYGHPATHSQMISPSPFGEASREYLPGHMASERATGRESFPFQNLRQSPPIAPPLRQETSGSSSQYQSKHPHPFIGKMVHRGLLRDLHRILVILVLKDTLQAQAFPIIHHDHHSHHYPLLHSDRLKTYRLRFMVRHYPMPHQRPLWVRSRPTGFDVHLC